MNLGLLQDRIAFFDPEFLDVDKEIDSRFPQMRERNFFSSDLVPGNESIVVAVIALLPFIIALAIKLFQWIATLIAKVYARWKAKKDSQKYGENCSAARMARYVQRANLKFKFDPEITNEFLDLQSKLAKQVRSFQENVEKMQFGVLVKEIEAIFANIIRFDETALKAVERNMPGAKINPDKNAREEATKINDKIYNATAKLKEVAARGLVVLADDSILKHLGTAVNLVNEAVTKEFDQSVDVLRKVSDAMKKYLNGGTIDLSVVTDLSVVLSRLSKAKGSITTAMSHEEFARILAGGNDAIQTQNKGVSNLTLEQFIGLTEKIQREIDLSGFENSRDKIQKLVTTLEPMAKDAEAVKEKIYGVDKDKISQTEREQFGGLTKHVKRLGQALSIISKEIGNVCRVVNKLQSNISRVDNDVAEILQLAMTVINELDRQFNTMAHMIDEQKRKMSGFKI